MLDCIHNLFDTLNKKKIIYCHWKSNVYLENAIDGKTDIDILVDRRHVGMFESTIASMHFKMTKQPGEEEQPIYHCYGMDAKTGTIIHLHVYYRLVTGGNLLKNYFLPLEEMLLSNAQYIGLVRVPSKAAELTLLVIRKILEHAALAEMLLLYREYDAVKKELNWLLNDETERETEELLQYWLPALDTSFFSECVNELKPEGSIVRRILLARKMRHRLKNYTKYGLLRVFAIRNYEIFIRICMRLLKLKKRRIFITGGSVIAIVGPEATGKSTLHKEIRSWLGEQFRTVKAHAGKPPSTWLTFFPNIVVPGLRKLFPKHRINRIEKEMQEAKRENSEIKNIKFLLYAIRSILVAFDRKTLLLTVFRKASKGAIVICDRYPTYEVGAMDSARLECSLFNRRSHSLSYILSNLENRIYKKIPPPNIVIKLTVPVEIALKRNVLRKKKGVENEDYVRRRHAQSGSLTYTTGCLYKIDTDQPLTETILAVKRCIWECL